MKRNKAGIAIKPFRNDPDYKTIDLWVVNSIRHMRLFNTILYNRVVNYKKHGFNIEKKLW